MSDSGNERGPAPFAVLDWIGVVVVVVTALVLLAFPVVVAPALKSMFADFGGTMPTITVVVISNWFGPLMGAVPLCAVAAAVGPLRHATIGKRRLMVVGAFVVSIAGIAVCMVGWYAPIFRMANAVGG